jgi:hypothetical protein
MRHMTDEERADASLVLPGNPQALKRIERIAKAAGARARATQRNATQRRRCALLCLCSLALPR